MVIVSGVFGIIGVLCAVVGILRASEVMPLIGADFTAMFWLVLSAISLLVSIATALSRSNYE